MKTIIFILYAVFGLLFLATLHLRPYFLDFVVKSLPIGLLALLAFGSFRTVRGRLLALALVFSCIGDVILELGYRGGFIFGLVSFLVAHLFYLAVFARNIGLTGGRSAIAVLLAVFGLVYGRILWPHLGPMLIPVCVYLAVIIIMGISAALGAVNHPLIILGALSFIASDSVLAANRFLTPISQSSLIVMVTYYLAQFLIFYGFSRTDGANG